MTPSERDRRLKLLGFKTDEELIEILSQQTTTANVMDKLRARDDLMARTGKAPPPNPLDARETRKRALRRERQPGTPRPHLLPEPSRRFLGDLPIEKR